MHVLCLTFSPYLFCHTLSSSPSLISRFCVILFLIPFPSPLPPSLLFLHHFTLRTPKVLLSASLLSLAKYHVFARNFQVIIHLNHRNSISSHVFTYTYPYVFLVSFVLLHPSHLKIALLNISHSFSWIVIRFFVCPKSDRMYGIPLCSRTRMVVSLTLIFPKQFSHLSFRNSSSVSFPILCPLQKKTNLFFFPIFYIQKPFPFKQNISKQSLINCTNLPRLPRSMTSIFSLIDQVVKTCRHPESPVVLGILYTEGDDQLEMWTETSNFTFKIHEGELYVAQRSEDDYSVGSINHDNLLDTLVSAVQSCFQHAQDDFHGDYEDGEFEQELEQFDPSYTYIRSIATACIERMNINVLSMNNNV